MIRYSSTLQDNKETIMRDRIRDSMITVALAAAAAGACITAPIGRTQAQAPAGRRPTMTAPWIL